MWRYRSRALSAPARALGNRTFARPRPPVTRLIRAMVLSSPSIACQSACTETRSTPDSRGDVPFGAAARS
jgi:hypothetical protein